MSKFSTPYKKSLQSAHTDSLIYFKPYIPQSNRTILYKIKHTTANTLVSTVVYIFTYSNNIKVNINYTSVVFTDSNSSIISFEGFFVKSETTKLTINAKANPGTSEYRLDAA